jgi:predicted unusual protein kinase regulating ubiquinone biosynthesis (AarF/ABC1/UbiB family)
VGDLRARLLEECDYRHEAAAQSRFAERWVSDPDLVIPVVQPDRSAESVLTTSWEHGAPFEAYVASATAADKDHTAYTMIRFALTSLFVHAEIHADPHPGNLLFRGRQVVVLDFGCVRGFSPAYVAARRERTRAALAGDRRAFADSLITTRVVDDPTTIDLDQQLAQERWLWEPYLGGPFRFDRAWAARGRDFQSPSNPNLRKVRMPPEEVWVLRTLVGLHAVLGRLGAQGRYDLLLHEILATPVRSAA